VTGRFKHAAGSAVRRVAPGSVAALEDVRRLRTELGDQIAAGRELDRRLGELAGAQADLQRSQDGLHERLGRLEDRLAGGEHATRQVQDALAGLSGDVEESRRLSLRVAQLTDLVFDRLADAPGVSQNRD
jgi:chromosome segregation ATPase